MVHEWTFRVRLSDASVKSINAAVDRPLGSQPYYRCDFDGKIMQSELCSAAGDPAWQHKATFDYRLDEDDLQSLVASLASRVVTFEVFYTDQGTRHVSLGVATVDLYTIATGAAKLQLGLRKANANSSSTGNGNGGGDIVGVLHVTLAMEHLSVIETSLETLSLSNLAEPLQVQLAYSILEDQSAAPVESRISNTSRDPFFERCKPFLTRTSLRVFLNNTLRISFFDATRSNALMGAIDVPIKELLTSACDQSAVFKRNLYADPAYRKPFTAHVTGTVALRNLPCFAQLENGMNVNGQVHGKPLLEGMMLPPRYSKFPARLPDYRPATQPTHTPAAGRAPDVSTMLPPSGIPMTEARLATGRPESVMPTAATLPTRVKSPNQSIAAASLYSAHRAAADYHSAAAAEESRALSPRRQPNSPELQRKAPPPQNIHRSNAPPDLNATPIPNRTAGVTAAAGSGAMAAQLRRFDPSRSPLATAASALQQQHDEAMASIEDQRRRVAMLTEELRSRTQSEQDSERRRADAISVEDRTLHSRFEATTRNIEELRRLVDETEAAGTTEANEIRAERVALEGELDELARTEQELTDFVQALQMHAEENERKRLIAHRQAIEAKELLDSDMHALADFESRVAQRNRLRAGASPRRNVPSSPPRGEEPYHHHHASEPLHAGVGMGTSTYTAPSQHNSGSMFVKGSPRRGHSATVGELLDAITTGNDAAFLRALQTSPDLLHHEHYWLLRACGAPCPNDAIVGAILRQRPELLHMIDPATANTPLHCACNSQRPNSGVVTMLLQHGANPYAFNANGLTPMHLAMLNVNDYDHQVKRELMMRGGIGLLNQPASSGETAAHMCAANDRHLPALRFLSENGANLNAVAMLIRDGRPTAASPRDRAVWAGRDAEGCRRFLEGSR
jgi:hypothetical protein